MKVKVWTVYDHPKDYRHGYIARLFLNDVPTDEAIAHPLLRVIRSILARRGFMRFDRHPADDLTIMETWI